MSNDPEVVAVVSEFFLSKQGVILKIQNKADYVFRGAFFYDGRNQAILGRNNKDYFLVKSIPPPMRQKIFQDNKVIVMECSKDEVNQAYEVEVIRVDEIPGEDTYAEDYRKYMQKLEEMYGKDRMSKFKKAALEAWRKFIS